MRGFFQRGAQRDSLRTKNQTIELSNSGKAPVNKGGKRPRLPGRKHIVSAFLLAALGNEASHFHETHNPHTNRRERIEEIRMRLSEVESNSRRYRNINAGGSGSPDPSQPVEIAVQEARRRGNGLRPAQNV